MKSEKITGVVILALGITMVILTSLIPVKTFSDDPGPRIFPYLGSFLLVISGLGILFTKSKKEKSVKDEPFLTKEGWKRAGIMTSLFIIFALALKFLGFLIATPVMLYLFYRQIAGPEKTRPVKGIIYSLITFAAVYVVFSKVLNSFLPPGIFF